MANISDVARLVEVSERTVSRVLNEDPRVSARTRKAVLAAMAELAYVPNQAARSLRGARTRTIGLVLFDLNNLALLQVAPALEEVVREHGYSLFLCDSQNSTEVEAANLRRLYEQRVEGLVAFLAGGSCAALSFFADAGVPAVALPATAQQLPPAVTYLRLHVPTGLAEALRHLVELGHRRVLVFRSGLLSFGGSDYDLQDLGAGLPLDLDPALDLTCDGGLPAREAMTALLQGPNPPTAVLSYVHAFSPYLLQGIQDAGVAIPEQLSFITMGDSPWAAAYRPSLTAVRFDFPLIGRRLGEYLFARLDGNPAEELLSEIRGLLVPKLVRRASCAPPRGNQLNSQAPPPFPVPLTDTPLVG